MPWPQAELRSRRTLLLVNPTAGGGRARQAKRQVTGYLCSHGAAFHVVESRSAEHLEELAAVAEAAGYSHLAILGGDGAFHYALNGSFGRSIVLAFFPCGNGNDIAMGLGIPTDAVAAVHEFLRRRPKRVDVLRTRCSGGRQRIFIGAGGLGLDAEAARLVHGQFRRWPGVARYIGAAFWALARFEPLLLRATFDDLAWQGRVLIAAVANSPSYGAGVKIAPTARMDDGWMDITIADDLPWTRIVEAILPLLRDGDLRWPEIHRFRARRARFETDRGILMHGDGELLGETPAEIEVLPGAVQIAGIPGA